MPRPLLIRTDRFVYHVTSRSNNKEWFYTPTRDCWDVFTKQLTLAAERYRLEISLLVLMSNHFHLLVSTPDKNIDAAMRYFLSCVTKEIQRRTGRINHVFGARYHWSILESAYSLGYVYKYVARNPVRAGICERVEDYPFSTANDPRYRIPVIEGFNPYWRAIPRWQEARSQWLNKAAGRSSEQLIGRALRRYRFEFTSASNFQKDLRLLRNEYGVEETSSSGTF